MTAVRDAGTGSAGERLHAGARGLGVELEQRQHTRLMGYLDELRRWNKAYNLVSAASLTDAVPRHLLDCLSVLPHIHGKRLLDIGTGAGLPGLILAISRPDIRVTLLDSNTKKTRFCRHVATALGLDNVTVETSRVENFQSELPFSTVVSRAFGSVQELVTCSARLCDSEARILAMKGVLPSVEVDALGVMRDNVRMLRLDVPELGAERHLIVVRVAGEGDTAVR